MENRELPDPTFSVSPFYTPNFALRIESVLWCNSSISAREADGPGANPGFLTI
jgi:hypothetical protein